MAVLGCSWALPIFHVPGITWEPCPSADSAEQAQTGLPGGAGAGGSQGYTPRPQV